MTWLPYNGTLNTRSNAMGRMALRAYGIWNSQRQRCHNPKDHAYKYYGAKGIRVEYEVRDFIGWWIASYLVVKPKSPSVGRIDHSKNYSFDNIEMVEHADNAREMYHRTGGNITVASTPVVLFNDEECHAFSTNIYAAKFAGVTSSLICLRKRMSPKDYTKSSFKYKVMSLDQFMEAK